MIFWKCTPSHLVFLFTLIISPSSLKRSAWFELNLEWSSSSPEKSILAPFKNAIDGCLDLAYVSWIIYNLFQTEWNKDGWQP